MEDKKYIQLQFSDLAEGQIDQLIALLADVGYDGFEENENSLKSFIAEEKFISQDVEEVLKLIPAVYSKSIVVEQNWNAQWESSFAPIVVKDFVGIRADFHQPIKNVQHEIIITPKMSFGTGHHATTHMMIEQMQGIDFTNKTVVDFGTGTAVLAILAEKMGAVSVDAIDYDEWSIENSFENTATNNCTNINLIMAETIATDKVYDIILANINLNVILANLQKITAVTKKGTLVLLSGFIKTDESTMISMLSEYNMQHITTVEKTNWICLLAEMK
ncbi:MAG: 50S ribosomal protein L11 methyltransferase [Ferruginibacter sp.]